MRAKNTFPAILKATIIFLSAFLAVHASAQSTAWVQQGKAPKTERGNGIAHDNNGNLYITGTFQDSVRFNTILLTASFGNYCAKYDTTGAIIWAYNNLGGDGVVFDGSSGLYLFSNTNNTLQKIDLNGTIVWSINLYTSSTFGSNGIQGVFVKGPDVYVTGFYSGDAYFGNDTLYNAGGWDIFIAKFNSSGQYQWAKTAGGAGLDKGYDLYVNNANEIYAVGYFNGTADFDTASLVSNGSADMFLAKYSANGDLQWVNKYGDTGFDLAAKIIADDNGSLYTTGRFYSTITFGSAILYGNNSDAFITKFDVNGNVAWAKDISGMGNDEEADLDYENGKLVFIATTAGNLTIDAFTHAALGNLDICIGKIDTAGTVQWVKLFGSSSDDEGSGVFILNGNTYFTGSFTTTADFDSYQLTSQGQWDIVTGKIDDQLSTGVSRDERNDEVSIFPNPANEKLTLVFSNPSVQADLFIFNAAGQLVLKQNDAGGMMSIDISAFPAGLYFLQLQNGNDIAIKKFSVAH